MKCNWATGTPLLEDYHDKEWGTPVHDDQLLFEHFALDSFQAGLSWSTILNKRENFRKAFNNFHIEEVSKFDLKKIESMLSDQGIIRNRMKIEATINNARLILDLQKEFASFDNYIWKFVNHQTIHNFWKTMGDIPATSPESDAMSLELKKRGFKFTGSTICYAFMQATGMINDHLTECFRYKEILSMKH
jgi:DNA-3-methyladenine glycosylase I